MTVVVLEDDLLFVSRIREAAKAKGNPVQVVRTGSALLEACRQAPPALVLVDLDSPRLAALDAIRALRAETALSSVHIVGFFSHVHAERAVEARAAGCDRVLARSAFVQELPRLLAVAAGHQSA